MKVYFDNAATTPLHPKVLEAMLPYLKGDFGNPSSIHSYGSRIKVKVEESRETVAEFINADASEIYFSSGGTEAVNFPILGIAKSEFENSGRDHIITSKAEHHAVLESFNELGKIGFDTSFLNVTNDSSVKADELKNIIRPSTSLISVMHVNNETGTINDLKKLTESCNQSSIFYHSDTVQSFGKFPINVKGLGIHSISVSGHKIYGPKGIGFTWVKGSTPLASMHFGGSQERNRRGGTENVPGIIGLAEAVKIASIEMDHNLNIISELRDHFINGIKSIDSGHIFINGGSNISPYILSITFDGEYYKNDGEAMLIFLDINGIAASHGSACSSGTLKPSHVMLSSGKTELDTAGTIRFSFNPNNSIEEVEYTLEVLKKMSANFRRL